MLKIKIIAIGAHKDPWVNTGCDHFTKMLSRYAEIDFTPIPSPKLSASLSPDEIRKAEAVPLQKALARGLVVALSDSGKELDSPALARALESWQASSGGLINFLVGGPHGLHADLLARADLVLSLSRLTFSHQIVRLVLLEQLYRAFSILHGTDYHK